MIDDKAKMKRKIWELDFALHELNLFLDSNPKSKKGIDLLYAYRKSRKEALEAYEAKYGKYICTVSDVEPDEKFTWIESPWPWENGFAEE